MCLRGAGGVGVRCSRSQAEGSHEVPDEARARSQAYTQHLTEYLEAFLSDMAKGGFVGEGPSPPEAPETPADDPVPPGGPALPPGNRTSLGPRRPSFPPPGPTDPGWVLIRIDGLCGQQDADNWRYIVQLAGYTRRYGLLLGTCPWVPASAASLVLVTIVVVRVVNVYAILF